MTSADGSRNRFPTPVPPKDGNQGTTPHPGRRFAKRPAVDAGVIRGWPVPKFPAVPMGGNCLSASQSIGRHANKQRESETQAAQYARAHEGDDMEPYKRIGPRLGRPKGVPNKATREFRETVRRLLEDNAENVGRWLKTVAEGDGTPNSKPDPAKALDLLVRLAEFAAAKLGRVEHVGAEGGPLVVKVVKPDA